MAECAGAYIRHRILYIDTLGSLENLSITCFTKILRSAPFHDKSAELLTSVNLVFTPETKMTDILGTVDGTTNATISDELFNWYYLTIK